MGWQVLVPVKGTGAKSRLQHPLRERLAVAMTDDVVAVAHATDDVDLVLRIPAGPDGLDADVAAAASGLLGRRIAVLMGDLPALTPAALAAALAAASVHPGAVVADAEGEGTVLLTAVDAALPGPAFGAGSLRRHVAAGAVDVTAQLGERAAGLRRDVDTVEDLADARRLGLGPATTAALGDAPGTARRAPEA